MMREVVRAFKAILQERRGSVRDWIDVVPLIQWALNTAYRERYGSTPYHVMFGRAPKTSFQPASSSGDDWNVDVLDAQALQRYVQYVVEAHLHKEVLAKVESTRAKHRKSASRGQFRTFQLATISRGAGSSWWFGFETGIIYVDGSVTRGYHWPKTCLWYPEHHLWRGAGCASAFLFDS